MEHDVIVLRQFESILMITMTFKILYFMRLIGEMAPLIDIMFIILRDIKWFFVIYMIAEFAFMCSFYSIGRNQEDIINATEGSKE